MISQMKTVRKVTVDILAVLGYFIFIISFTLELFIHWGSFTAALILVLWQIYAGAAKFLSNPIATKTFTGDFTAPHITVCHEFPDFGYPLDQFGIELQEFEDEGHFSTQNTSAETVFNHVTQKYYYVLDSSGRNI